MATEPYNEQITADAVAIWKAGVAAVDGRRIVAQQVRLTEEQLHVADVSFNLNDIDRVIVVGAGKASGWMAAGFEDAVGEAFLDQRVTGWINVPDDQAITLRSIKVVGCRPAGQNLPTDRVLAGTTKILDYVRGAGPRELVVFMVAGGGSALLEQPVEPISLADFRAVTSMLSASGADIQQLNTVRRAISLVKAGGLTRACGAGQLVALIVSDVIGDPLEVIASGPTVVGGVLGLNPKDVIRKFDPQLKQTPASVLAVLDRSDTSDQTDLWVAPPCRVHNRVLCNNQTAVAAAKQKAIDLGYDVVRTLTSGSSDRATSVAVELADELISLAGSAGRRCVISGGEPTVALSDTPGRGGRNQHLVLAALQRLGLEKSSIDQLDRVSFCLLSGGTDGEDGNVPVAGAWLDSEIDAAAMMPEINAALDECDSYRVFERIGRLLRVPPTRTNVCDLRVMLVDRE